MSIVGGLLFALGIMGFLGAQLQHTDFLILSPYYILIMTGVGISIWKEWKDSKIPNKKISIFSLSCFLLGFSGLLMQEGNLWFFEIISILSVISGVIFKIRNKERQYVGNALLLG